MKKLLLILTGLLFISQAFSQISLGDDGIYYDKDQAPYTGEYREFYDNGQIRQEMNLMSGRIDGKVSIWYRTGFLKETRMFSAGLRNGLWISYNEKGVKTGEASYKEDQKDGPWRIWDENGTLRYEMLYRKGLKSGVWIMYDANGNKTDEKKYSDEK